MVAEPIGVSYGTCNSLEFELEEQVQHTRPQLFRLFGVSSKSSQRISKILPSIIDFHIFTTDFLFVLILQYDILFMLS